MGGGKASIVQKYSYHASIEAHAPPGGSGADGKKLRYLCSGAIVSVNHVLTTASCVAGREPGELRVRAGSAEVEKYGLVYEVRKLLYRRNFNVTRNNVALLRLKRYFHPDVTKIHLFQNVHEFDARADLNGTGTLTAYGRVGGTEYTRLLARNVTAFRSNSCKLALVSSPEEIVCRGFYGNASRSDECFTHVGGLVLVDRQLVGFVLYPDCGRSLVPGGLYMELFRFYDWVFDRAEDAV